MKSSSAITFAAAAAALAIGFAVAAVEPVRSATAEKPGAGAVVIVSKATKACFSASVQVTGFLVPRREAMVNLDMEGFRVSEILVNEGDQVNSGQNLVRLVRATEAGPAAGGAQSPGAAAGPSTLTLRAPAAGTITRSTAAIGATFSPRAEPLFPSTARSSSKRRFRASTCPSWHPARRRGSRSKAAAS